MDIMLFDAALRASAATTILLLAWLLFRQRQQVGLPAILFAPLAICLSAFVIGNTPTPSLRPGSGAAEVAHLLSGYTVIFLWWFCLACFDGRFRPKGGTLAGGVAWAIIAALDRGLLGPAVANRGLSALLVALGFGIVGHLVWRLLAERSGDLVQRRHDARFLVAGLLGGMLFVDLLADTLFGFAWRPLPFAMAQNAMILSFCLWLAGRVLVARPDVLTFGLAAQASPILATAQRPAGEAGHELHRRLAALIEEERIYLDPALTFAAFVARMGASERTVRQLINHDLGYDHFRTFLNHHRIAEARRRLADPAHGADKLITIGFDSGFSSLASFNRVFRDVEGCSPGAYRASRLGEDGAPPGFTPTAGF